LCLRPRGLLARAWARSVSLPSADSHGRPRGCLPRLPAGLQPFPPVSPERGGAFGSPPPAYRLSFWQPRDSQSRLKLAPQPGFLPRRRRRRSLPCPCARLPSLGPRKSPQAPPTRSRSLVIPGLGQSTVFFSRFRVHPASSGPPPPPHLHSTPTPTPTLYNNDPKPVLPFTASASSSRPRTPPYLTHKKNPHKLKEPIPFTPPG
jgi:hypothetical protein